MRQSLWIISSNRVLISVFAFSKFYVVVLIFRVNCPFNPKLRTDYYDRCSQELISIYSLGGVTQESHQTQKNHLHAAQLQSLHHTDNYTDKIHKHTSTNTAH